MPETPLSLRQALGMRPGEVVSIVGGGGKTTILYRLGDETVASGGCAIITGTTRFTPRRRATQPPMVFAVREQEMLARLSEALCASPLVVAGAGWGNKGRILPVEAQWLREMAALPGVAAVVAEADGSAGRPFKAPAEHEPVVAAATTLLLSIVGIDVLGKPLAVQNVHRPECVAAIAGVQCGTPVDETIIATVLLHPLGGRKGLPAGARWTPVLNKVETEHERGAARRIAGLLCAGGAERVLLTRANHSAAVVEVVA